MLGAGTFASRPLASASRLPRPFAVAAVLGEYGVAVWSYSRQAKLNAWGWHGVGALGNVLAWATLSNAVYIRNDVNNLVYVMQPDVFLSADDANAESTSVEATTQWLDFGKPGVMKALTGIDFDGQNVTAVEVYLSENGDRTGTLAETVAIGSNQGGWTYSGEIVPLSSCGTEFKLRFVGDPNQEVQVNRLTLYWDPVAG